MSFPTSRFPPTSMNPTMPLVKVFVEDVEEDDGLEVVVHQQEDDSNVSVEECEFNDCIRTLAMTNLTPSEDIAQLGVVRCTLA